MPKPTKTTKPPAEVQAEATTTPTPTAPVSSAADGPTPSSDHGDQTFEDCLSKNLQRVAFPILYSGAIPELERVLLRVDPLWGLRGISDVFKENFMDLGATPEHLLPAGHVQSSVDVEFLASSFEVAVRARKELLSVLSPTPPANTPLRQRRIIHDDEDDDYEPSSAFEDVVPLAVKTRSQTSEDLDPATRAMLEKRLRVSNPEFSYDHHLESSPASMESLSSTVSIPSAQDDPRDRDQQLPKQLRDLGSDDVRRLPVEYQRNRPRDVTPVRDQAPAKKVSRDRGWGTTDQDDEDLVVRATSLVEARIEDLGRAVRDLNTAMGPETAKRYPHADRLQDGLERVDELSARITSVSEDIRAPMRQLLHEPAAVPTFRYSQGQTLPDRQVRTLTANLSTVRRSLTMLRKRIEEAIDRAWCNTAKRDEGFDDDDADNDDPSNDGPSCDRPPTNGSSQAGHGGSGHGGSSHGGSSHGGASRVGSADAYAHNVRSSFSTPPLRSKKVTPPRPSAVPHQKGATFHVNDLVTKPNLSESDSDSDCPSLVDDDSSDEEDSAKRVQLPKVVPPPSPSPRLQHSALEVGDGPIPMAKNVSAMFLSSLAKMSSQRASSTKCDWKDRNEFIRNTIGVLRSLEFVDVLNFVTSINRYAAIFPGQALNWPQCIHPDVVAILVPVLERLYEERVIFTTVTRHLTGLTCQEVVLAIVDRVSPTSFAEMRKLLLQVVPPLSYEGAPTYRFWLTTLGRISTVQDALTLLSARLGSAPEFPAPSMQPHMPNSIASVLREVFSPELIDPVLDEVYNPDSRHFGLPKVSRLNWSHMEPFMCAIKRVVQRYIDEAQRNERYQAKWSSAVPSKTRETTPKSRLALVSSDSTNPTALDDDSVSCSRGPTESPNLLTTRGPFGAPGSGQPRDGFRMDGRRILPRPHDVQSRPPNLDSGATHSTASDKVCYRFARGQCDRADCQFSHDIKLALEFMQSEFAKNRPRVHILDAVSDVDDDDHSDTSDSHED